MSSPAKSQPFRGKRVAEIPPAPVQVPVTPRKPRDNPVEGYIHAFNQDYGLSTQLPDPSQSPVRRKERAARDKTFARWDQIYQGLHHLHYRRDGSIEKVNRAFFYEAKARSQRWPPLPGQDLVTSGDFPRAATPGQQHELEELLVDVIAQVKSTPHQDGNGPVMVPRPNDVRSSTTIAVGDFAQDAVSLAEVSPPSRPKRPPHDWHESSSKRPRSGGPHPDDDEEPARVYYALDNTPSRQRQGMPGHRESPIPFGAGDFMPVAADRASLFNTSKQSMVPTLFTQRTGSTVQTSQSTVELSSQEHKETLQQFFTSTSDDYPASSGEVLALRDSFTLHESRSAETAGPDLGFDTPIAPIAEKSLRVEKSLRTAEVVKVMQDVAVRIEPVKPGSGLSAHLDGIWPKCPPWLRSVPIAVAWETTRVFLHCGVDLAHPELDHRPEWAASRDLSQLRKSLAVLPMLQGKTFPERPSTEAWEAALGDFSTRGNVAVLSLSLDLSGRSGGPLFHVRMNPVTLQQGYRLARRFGADRFLEVTMPSLHTARDLPPSMKEDGPGQIAKWLTDGPHDFLGCRWAPFFLRDAGYKKPPTEFRLGPESEKAVFKDRVTFFAESGFGFRPLPDGVPYPVPSEKLDQKYICRVDTMLEWLLQPAENAEQPHLKLFTRIQLGLSKTYSILVLRPEQIRHHDTDLTSPAAAVMNDGIGRMSRGVARKIRDVLGLPDIPSAVQGRLGSAKGMWILDVADTGEECWIETYPSQRKWKCSQTDPAQRTLEIRSHAAELRPAGLNMQFIPVLEDRAKDRPQMRRVLGEMLTKDLEQEFEKHKTAMRRPVDFRLWSHQNFSQRKMRVHHGRVPFLAGLPVGKEEKLNFLLDSGFDPTKLKYIQEIAWDLQKQKCELLKSKLKIKVPRSTYAYMVVDFWGLLEEGEVHLGFSSRFQDDEVSDLMLHDIDVLVARSPAHFPSDIQKVRAVFKTELRALRDVIVFSAKGNRPLADKLSGGDYDGDQAWVCWDSQIVDNFVNADSAPALDLSAYLRKDSTTYGDLLRSFGPGEATREMMARSFRFSMQRSMLGICTNYKERLCYRSNSVSDANAILLSTLLSNLVDQLKSGIEFGEADFNQLRRERLRLDSPAPLGEPAYKNDAWRHKAPPEHIIDHLKFLIAKPAIDRELAAYHRAMNPVSRGPGPSPGQESLAQWWDPDLSQVHNDFKKIKSQTCSEILKALKSRIGAVELKWKKTMNRESTTPYPELVKEIYSDWCEIRALTLNQHGAKIDSKTILLLEQSYLPDLELSHWALLKASTVFKFYYKKSPKFVWQMAGRQLAMIKAMMTRGDGVPTLSTPLMYAALVPDKKFVMQLTARMEGFESAYMETMERNDASDDDMNFDE